MFTQFFIIGIKFLSEKLLGAGKIIFFRNEVSLLSFYKIKAIQKGKFSRV